MVYMLSYGDGFWIGNPNTFSADIDELLAIIILGPIVGGFIAGFAISVNERYTQAIRINPNFSGAFLGYLCILFADLVLILALSVTPSHIELAILTNLGEMANSIVTNFLAYSLLGALGGFLGAMLRRRFKFGIAKVQNRCFS